MKIWQALLLGIFLGLLSTGAILLIAKQPSGYSIELLPPPTPANIVVYVTGEVINPGIYSLLPGCRVNDAIQAASGFSTSADKNGVNLAMLINDGDKIFVPKIGELSTVQTSIPQQPTSAQNVQNQISKEKPLNINQADQGELELLPGIGPTKANAIIEYRLKNGLFNRKDDILNVPGIGPVIYDQIKDFITT